MRAQEAYMGQAFRMAKEILIARRLKWCILSGYYGFLWPSTVIENYDMKMEPVTENTDWECFDMLNNRQYGKLLTADHVVVIGSRLYSDAATHLLQRTVDAPLAGLPIGRMLQKIMLREWIHEPTTGKRILSTK